MRFNWGRLPGEVRAIGGFQRRALPARPGSSCHWVRRSPTIRRPGAGRGPVPLVFIVCLVACLRLAVIGRVSPRRATIFLVATRKVDKETPPAAAPALAGALAPPTAGGSRRNSPSRAQTSTRQFPPAAGCARRCRRGRPLPARLRHRRQRALPLSRARHSDAIRRPGAGRRSPSNPLEQPIELIRRRPIPLHDPPRQLIDLLRRVLHLLLEIRLLLGAQPVRPRVAGE